jgi:acyl carrier protein
MDQYTTEQIRAVVKQLIGEILEKPPEDISDTAMFRDELGLDSLMAAELLVSVERKYQIQIPEDEFTAIKNVNDAVAAAQRHLPKAASA